MADLTYVDVTTDWFNVTLASGYTRDTVQGQFRYRVEPNGDKSAYNLSVWTRLRSRYTFNWNGQGNLSVTITWTGVDGSSKRYYNSMETNTPLHIDQTSTEYQETAWNGPLQFTGITATGVQSLNFNVDLDFLRTVCLVCDEDGVTPAGKGPGVVSSSWGHVDDGYDHDHYQHFYDSRTVNVEQIPLVYPVTLSSITNTNKHLNNNNVSASTNSISLSWLLSGNAGTSYYKVDSGNWIASSSTTSVTISNLSAGTSYAIQIKNVNESGDSNILSITIQKIKIGHAAILCRLSLDDLFRRRIYGKGKRIFVQKRFQPSDRAARHTNGERKLLSVLRSGQSVFLRVSAKRGRFKFIKRDPLGA